MNDKLLECMAKYNITCRDRLVRVIENVQDRVHHLTNNWCCLGIRMVIDSEHSMKEIDTQTEVI